MTSTSSLPDPSVYKRFKGIILDTWSLTEQLVFLTNDYETRAFGRLVSNITKPNAFEIIRACIDCHLNNKMKWTKEKIDFDEVVYKYVPWAKENDPLARDYLLNIVDAIEIQLIYRLNSVIDDKTWDIWTTEIIGFDIVLKNRGDYRVHDWYKRLSDQERKVYEKDVHL